MRPDEQTVTSAAVLSHRRVVLLPRRVGQIAIDDVRGDADDRRAGNRVGADADALAERVGLWPNLLRHRLADDDDAWRALVVGAGEAAAAHDARPHRREIARRDNVVQILTANGVARLREEIFGPAHPERHGDRYRCVPHAGNSPCPLDEVTAERDPAEGIDVHSAHLDGYEQDVGSIVAEVELMHIAQAAHEEPGPDEEHDGERALDDEQGRARARAMIRPFAGAGLERRRDVGASREERRGNAGEHADGGRGGRGKYEHTWIGEERWPFDVGEHRGAEDRASPLGDEEPGDSAEQSEERALGEQLDKQSAAADAERHAYGDLAAPSEGTGEEQVRNVGAGDEKDDDGDADQPGRDFRIIPLVRSALFQDRGSDGARPSEVDGRDLALAGLRQVATAVRIGQVRVRGAAADLWLPPHEHLHPAHVVCRVPFGRVHRGAAEDVGNASGDRDEGHGSDRIHADEAARRDADDGISLPA